MDQSLFAAPHGFSQRTTSFIASQRQGIHQMPLSRLIALISQCPDKPDNTSMERRCGPNSRWPAFAGQHSLDLGSPALERPVARICLSFPTLGRGVRSGAPRHAPDDVHCTSPAPRHGKSNPFFTMSKISITSREAAGKSCLVPWVVQPRHQMSRPDPKSAHSRLRVVGLGRLELPTSRLSGVRSNQTELQARFPRESRALPKATLEERETKTARPA